MAGIFGFFNYAKPGKGVDKNAPEKKRFFVYTEMFGRKFWKIIQLNLLFLLFSIPIVTIAPSFVAMNKVMKEMVNERGIFLFSDFVDAFKQNFKQSFLFGLLDVVLGIVMSITLVFYFQNANSSTLMLVLFGVSCFFSIFWICVNYYMLTMIPILDMKLIPMMRNAALLAVVGLKSNIVTFLSLLLVNGGVVVLFMWGTVQAMVAMLLVLTFSFGWSAFTIVFISYPVINKYIIDPYYEQTGELRPDEFHYEEDEFDDMIFEDIGTKEVAVQQKGNKGKTIR